MPYCGDPLYSNKKMSVDVLPSFDSVRLQGFGMLLMEEAERIARDEHGAWKLAVISGVGTRNYYRKLGYELDGPYMSKTLEEEEAEW